MSRSNETTMLPSSLAFRGSSSSCCSQGGVAGLATMEMRAPHVLRGIHIERRRERVLGCCRCVDATCENRPFQAWQFNAEPEILCRRCKMKPAPANTYNPEVMRALKSRGGPIWTRLLKGEVDSRPPSRRTAAVQPECARS